MHSSPHLLAQAEIFVVNQPFSLLPSGPFCITAPPSNLVPENLPFLPADLVAARVHGYFLAPSVNLF